MNMDVNTVVHGGTICSVAGNVLLPKITAGMAPKEYTACSNREPREICHRKAMVQMTIKPMVTTGLMRVGLSSWSGITWQLQRR